MSCKMEVFDKTLYTVTIIDLYTITYYLHNNNMVLHNDEGPAVIYKTGRKEWYKYGKLHRIDGPAIIWADDTQEWYKDGKLHREDGPAVICPDGTQHWFKNGMWHRIDGPAIKYPDGRQKWYVNDYGITDLVNEWLDYNNYTVDNFNITEFKLRFL